MFSWKRQTKGIVLGAIGHDFVDEALRAAASIKAHMSIEVHLTTDAEGIERCGRADTPFDKIHLYRGPSTMPEASRYVKLQSMLQSSFDKTLFVDSDVVFVSAVDDIFDALGHWHLAACHAPWREGLEQPEYDLHLASTQKKLDARCSTLRHVYPEINCGVLAFCGKGRRAVTLWDKFYRKQIEFYRARPQYRLIPNDQRSFRRAVIHTKAKLLVLPSEFNVRVPFPYFVGGHAHARIVHGRGVELEKALESINSSVYPRIGLPRTGLIVA